MLASNKINKDHRKWKMTEIPIHTSFTVYLQPTRMTLNNAPTWNAIESDTGDKTD